MVVYYRLDIPDLTPPGDMGRLTWKEIRRSPHFDVIKRRVEELQEHWPITVIYRIVKVTEEIATVN